VRIGARVADVLVAAHDLGLVHRDLKPDNIMLEPAPGGLERVRVMDFGLAFIDGGEPGLGRVTLGKLVSGTPEYMSPEQVHGAKVTVEADLYALGCVLHEMLVGLPPLHDSSLAALLAKHLFTRPPRLREASPRLDVPSALEECVSALLAKDPKDRPSARRVRDLLTHLDMTASERLSPAGQAGGAGGRAARMISEPPPSALPKLPPDRSRELGVVGALPEDVVLGLASQGFEVCEVSEATQAAGLPLVLLYEPDTERVRSWVGRGHAVVAILSAPSFESLNALLRLGVDEIVVPPLTAATLGARLARALRKHARAPR
jgi:serine/threonine-protein kinase